MIELVHIWNCRVELSLRGMAGVVLLILLAGSVARGSTHDGKRLCGMHIIPDQSIELTDIGGRHITAHGTLRVLIVFASFPDDETPHPYWPPHAAPVFMEQFIDPDTATRSPSPFNLTNYFRQMSLDQFHLVGEAIWVETAHSQEEYRNGSYGRANRDILQERADSLVDFALYDQWTKQADYTHSNTPDGQVDMILMVWRTNIFEYLGEASLGYKPGFMADGKRIEMGFPEYLPFPLGSGVTIQYLYNDTPRLVMQTMVHELGHWLLGGPHPYNGESPQGKHIYWGMLCNGLRAASSVNAYERERLGWITVPHLPADVDVSLPDFLRSGVAFKFHPPDGEPVEYFYMENHQQNSIFDDVTVNPDDRGLWILHQQGPYMELDNLKIKPADGYWKWDSPATTAACFSTTLPVFKRGTPGVLTGLSHRDQIPTTTSAVNWMFAYKDDYRRLNCGAFFKGEMFNGAYTAEGNGVFSFYSNPNTNTWSNLTSTLALEIVRHQNDTVIVRRHSNALDGPPARRYLGIDPSAIPQNGMLSLAWGDQWTDGQPVESDVHWSEVHRRIGDEGNWVNVFEGDTRSRSDSSIHYDSSGAVPVCFRVRVRDTQGKYSTWSNLFITATTTTGVVGNWTGRDGAVPAEYALEANYPNPFNPSTTISFHIPRLSDKTQHDDQIHSVFTTLKVYNILGQEVRTLISGEMPAGSHEVRWDGTSNDRVDVPSGVYLYRMGAGDFQHTLKMILLR